MTRDLHDDRIFWRFMALLVVFMVLGGILTWMGVLK